LGVADPLDPELVEELYAEPPDRFITARGDLSTRLKSDGDVRAAKVVTALRKPSVAAWAVNRIARDRSSDVESLIRLGVNLAEAQRTVASEGGVDRLRDVGAERRRLVERLVREAATTLESAGMSAARATLDKVANTLMAIATDDDAAERVRRGVLDKELPAPSGFGDDALDASLLASVTQLPSRSTSTKAGSGLSPAQERKEREAARRRERLEAEAQELEREAARLEREASSATKAADAARRRADTARRRADDARPRD
jgi:hypothetical protein